MQKRVNDRKFRRFIHFLKKNKAAYVLGSVIVLILIFFIKLIYKSINHKNFDFKSFLSSLVDVKTLVTIVLVFFLTGLADVIVYLIEPKLEDLMKLTTDYNYLVRNYRKFSNLLSYTNKRDYCELGRKKTVSKAENYNAIKKSYEGNSDEYYFPITDVYSLYDKEVVINFDYENALVYKQPDWVKSHRDALFEAHSYSDIYNQQMFRVDNIINNPNNFQLYLSKTSYLDSLITNRACDYEINGVSVRKIYEPGPVLHSLKESVLSNHLGFNGMVETSDHKFIFIKRHNSVSIAKDKWQTSIGASLKTKFALTINKEVTKDSIKEAIIHEMIDEFNLKYLDNFNDIKFQMEENFQFEKNVLYFYRDLVECGKPQFMFYYQIPLTSNEIKTTLNNGYKTSKKNKNKFEDINSIDGHKLLFIDKEALYKIYLAPDGFVYDNKYYPSVPTSMATIAMMVMYLNNDNKE